jgi:PAS domain-containing protein
MLTPNSTSNPGRSPAFAMDRDRASETASKRNDDQLLRAAIDAIESRIAVLDETGRIMMVNCSWREFGGTHSGTWHDLVEGGDYLGHCDRAAPVSAEAAAVAAALRVAVAGEAAPSPIEYALSSPEGPQWFRVEIRPYLWRRKICVFVAHQNITEQRLREMELLRYAEDLELSRWRTESLLFELRMGEAGVEA